MRRGSAFVLLAATLGAPACLPDLAEPLVCPPPATNDAGECLAGLTMPQGQQGCYIEPDVACLRGGPAESCACLSGECPIPDATCYPDDECPEDVRLAAEDATCLRLSGDDIGRGLGDFQCLCGCSSCATVCDGYGTIWGTYGATQGQTTSLVIAFGDDELPDRGCFGMYWRLRGVANFLVNVFKGPPGQEQPTGAQFAITELGGDFVDEVLYGQAIVGAEPYCWETPADKPTGAVMQPLDIDTGFFVTMTEIDCVMPFFTPF